MKSDIGIIGLSVMGMNLALNMADKGYRVSIYNRTTEVVDRVMKEHGHENFTPAHSHEEFIGSLKKPRKIFLMVKAGAPVDMLIKQLEDLAEEGDIIIDGGNSYFKDTIRREKDLKEKGINYLGVGVSGGEEGARSGPALMPGGNREAYSEVSAILEDIAAKAYGEACCRYISEDGSGHYVKMVHNGIEYGDMQLISEAYYILKHAAGMTNEEIQKVFEEWNRGKLDSYLIEITSDILKARDGEGYLIDRILDKASQKGTGKWTNLEAIDLGVDISVISAALNARFMSNLKEERIKASKIIKKPLSKPETDRERLIELVKNSLYVSKIVSYAQGFRLMSEAEKAYGWNLDFSEIAKIFRGGCIIRARFLNDIAHAFEQDRKVANLMLTDFFSQEINRYTEDMRELLSQTVRQGIPAPAMTAALSYIDAYTTADSSANMIQAQRDYFGAHTFERVDREGIFHHNWTEEKK